MCRNCNTVLKPQQMNHSPLFITVLHSSRPHTLEPLVSNIMGTYTCTTGTAAPLAPPSVYKLMSIVQIPTCALLYKPVASDTAVGRYSSSLLISSLSLREISASTLSSPLDSTNPRTLASSFFSSNENPPSSSS